MRWQSGSAMSRKFSASDIGALLWAGLARHHPEVTEDQALDLADDIGVAELMETFSGAIGAALSASRQGWRTRGPSVAWTVDRFIAVGAEAGLKPDETMNSRRANFQISAMAPRAPITRQMAAHHVGRLACGGLHARQEAAGAGAAAAQARRTGKAAAIARADAGPGRGAQCRLGRQGSAQEGDALMAAVIGTLRAELAAKIAGFVSDMNEAAGAVGKFQKRFQGYSKKLTKAGVVMSAAVTAPLVALAKSSLDAFQESEKSVAAVEAVLKSMGNGAGFTSEQLQGMAASLQKVSTFDDDEILTKVTANLLTFGKVQGDVFKRAQQAALDLSTRLGTDLQSSAIMVGKALNDPLKGITALTRAGISFTAEQKEMIKSLVDTGKTAQAQQLILSELEKQVGGQAAAAAQTTSGQVSVLAHAWGDVQERIGQIVAKALPPLVAMLGTVVDWLNQLDPANFQRLVEAFGALAIGGPILLGLGQLTSILTKLPGLLQAIIALAPAVGTAFSVALGPIGLFVAGVAAAIYALNSNMASIQAFFKAWEAMTADFSNALGAKIEAGIAKVKQIFADFLAYVANFASQLIKIITDMATQVGGGDHPEAHGCLRCRQGENRPGQRLV
jgi:hypothetical protein